MSNKQDKFFLAALVFSIVGFITILIISLSYIFISFGNTIEWSMYLDYPYLRLLFIIAQIFFIVGLLSIIILFISKNKHK